MSANDKQVGGQHYASAADYQHWDLMADIYGQGYFKAQITRYVSRWRKKDGKQGLEKAIHYVEKLIELTQDSETQFLYNDATLPCVAEFCALNNLDMADADVIFATIGAERVEQLEAIKGVLNEMLKEV